MKVDGLFVLMFMGLLTVKGRKIEYIERFGLLFSVSLQMTNQQGYQSLAFVKCGPNLRPDYTRIDRWRACHICCLIMSTIRKSLMLLFTKFSFIGLFACIRSRLSNFRVKEVLVWQLTAGPRRRMENRSKSFVP